MERTQPRSLSEGGLVTRKCAICTGENPGLMHGAQSRGLPTAQHGWTTTGRKVGSLAEQQTFPRLEGAVSCRATFAVWQSSPAGRPRTAAAVPAGRAGSCPAGGSLGR